MRKFSIRPTLTIKGRKFNGLRGWSGKPTHPPLTDFPVAAYILGAVFDVISCIGSDEAWAGDFFKAGTFVFVGGGAVSLLTALTGFLDWLRTTEKGTQARRTANTHMTVMLTVTALVLVDIILRLNDYHTALDSHRRDPRPVDRRRGARGVRRDFWRHARVRLRLQRRELDRQPGVPPVGDRHFPRRTQGITVLARVSDLRGRKARQNAEVRAWMPVIRASRNFSCFARSQVVDHAGFDHAHLLVARGQHLAAGWGELRLADAAVVGMIVPAHQPELLQPEQHLIHRLRRHERSPGQLARSTARSVDRARSASCTG